jgi:uncharacterized Zn-binding protein involved in type VI secretion
MAGEIIRQGDSTSHGGKVLEGSLTDICMGKPIAYIGHKVSCPKCSGSHTIVEGVLTTTLFGKGVAVAGMKTSCGATLVAGQFTDTVEWSSGASGAGGSAAKAAAAAALAVTAAAAAAAAASHKFDEQIQLVDGAGKPLANTHYKIVASGGATFEGTTGADGKTQRVTTSAEETLNIYLKG